MTDQRRISWIWPAAAILLWFTLSVAHWAFGVDGFPDGALIMAAGWAYIEWMMSRGDTDRPEAIAIHSTHRIVFTAIGLYAALNNVLGLAADTAALDPAWMPAARRGMGALGGAMLAVWGNHLPKLLSPWRLEDEPFDWQGVHRSVGWLATLGGVAVVLSWTFLPLADAVTASRVVVVAVMVLALGTKFLSLATHRPTVR